MLKKHIAILCGWVMAGAAQAAVGVAQFNVVNPSALLDGQGTQIYSTYVLSPTQTQPLYISGAVGVWNILRAEVLPVAPSTVNAQPVLLTRGAYVRGNISVTSPITSISTDEAGGIAGFSAGGGTTWLAPYSQDVVAGGRVMVTNLRYDLNSRVVMADAALTPLDVVTDVNGALISATPGQEILRKDVRFMTFDMLGIPSATGLGGDRIQVQLSLSHLRLTPEGIALLADGFGTQPAELGYDVLEGFNNKPPGQGDFIATLTLQVPEPSTYVLMGLGLVGISMVARRRSVRAQAAAANLAA